MLSRPLGKPEGPRPGGAFGLVSYVNPPDTESYQPGREVAQEREAKEKRQPEWLARVEAADDNPLLHQGLKLLDDPCRPLALALHLS